MATIECFDDIEAWQKAVLVRRIYEVSGQGSPARDYGLRDQIRRASVSVLSKVAEGLNATGTRSSGSSCPMLKGRVAKYERSCMRHSMQVSSRRRTSPSYSVWRVRRAACCRGSLLT